MGEKTIHPMAFTTIKTAMLLFAALCLTFGFCQEKDIVSEDIVSEDALQTSSETTRTSELDQAGYGWRRRRGDNERRGKQNLRNAERGNKERTSKGTEASTKKKRKKAAAEKKSKNTAAERKFKKAAALKKEDTQKAQESKKEQNAKAHRKLENQHKHAHQQFRAKKAEKEAKKADIIRKWREIYQKSLAQAAAKLKRTFSEKVAKAKEKGSKKNVNVDKVARKCVKGRGKSEILGSMLLQWGFVKKSTDKVNVDKYVAKGQKAVKKATLHEQERL